MDTSIIVVIAIIVVFVVAVPTMIRKAATELSRVEIDTVPDEAQVVAADPQNPGHDHTERAKVFHSSSTAEPTVPRPDLAPMAGAPKLSLSAPTPEFALIDGDADTRSTTDTETTAEVDAQHQRSTLPVAVGQTRSTLLEDLTHSAHQVSASAATDNVRMLHPAVRAVFNQSQSGPTGGSSTGGSSTGRADLSQGASGRLGDHSRTNPVERRGSSLPSARHVGSSGSGTTGTTRRGTQIPNPTFGADEDDSMTEKATTLRESMKSLGTMTRGFALLFLASALGVLVTGLLAMFSVVHVAVTGVFLGLAIVSLVIVRSLNLRKREVKARLRELERPKVKRPVSRTSAAPASAAPKSTAAKAAGSTTATRKAPGSTKAAQARAVMQRNVTAKHSREEADTGEIPLVRIRNEAAEGHTTRQVLLTGPIPVVEEAPEAAEADAAEADAAGADAAEKTASGGSAPAAVSAPAVEAQDNTAPTPETAPTAETAPSTDSNPSVDLHPSTYSTTDAETTDAGSTDAGSTGVRSTDAKSAEAKPTPAESASAAEVSPESDSVDRTSEEATASSADSAGVNDPFMQRLKARDAWSPTPLPVPSYVDAPQVEHPVPETKAADASSYEAEARSREDIAAQFAAELGYRPELSDSARDDSPLEHGRKAIRTTKAPELGAVDDVLARRRA